MNRTPTHLFVRTYNIRFKSESLCYKHEKQLNKKTNYMKQVDI